jgi:tRNA dimethylallyltransferase
VGKSAVVLLLAERLGGEIISVDSMQVYRGLDIGTAKPSPADRARVPHHLIDVADLSETFDAARFVQLAREAVERIRARGKRPIFCGGSGLYFKAYLEGLGQAPPADPALRSALEQTPLPQLLEELSRRDPVTFGRIDQKNPRRIVRALEVIRRTGRPYSEQRAGWGPSTTHDDRASAPPFFYVTRTAADLRARIDARVEEMFRHGLVAETRRLLAQGLAENRTAMQAIGYRQVVEHLRGMRPLAETLELVKTRTRQYAKRQATWFKHQASPQSIHLAPEDSAEAVAERILGELAWVRRE